MKWRRFIDSASTDIARTALLACLIAGLLTSSVAMVSAARTIDIGPKVGDILVFHKGARMPPDWEFTVDTASEPGATCSLRPTVMASGGGSLVVEQRFETPRSFRVHWAGERTSDSGQDCGNNTQLIVTRMDLQLLTNAVGGAGVEHKAFPRL